jgi:hypothetical protein
MRRGKDPLGRLAAADPLPDAEQLTAEEQREADALLADLLATPVEAGERRPVRRRLRWALVAAAACAAAIVVAAVNVLDSDTTGPTIVERAVAAVSREDAVYHVLERRRGTGSGFPKGGQTIYSEYWRTTDGRMHGKAFAANGARRGRLLEEFAGKLRPGRTLGPALRYDPREDAVHPTGIGRPAGIDEVPDIDPFADPAARLRELQRRGQLRVADAIRFEGRRAYRLVADSPTRWHSFTFDGVEYLVDAKTYFPLTQRVSVRVDSERTYKLVTRYLVYERLPFDGRSRAQLALDPHPGAKCAPGAGKLEDRALGFPNPCRRSGG